MSQFDLLEYQKKARSAMSARELFLLWDKCSRYYERGLIGSNELSEMKEVIWKKFEVFSALKSSIDQAVQSA